jgi:hypothetical protein
VYMLLGLGAAVTAVALGKGVEKSSVGGCTS